MALTSLFIGDTVTKSIKLNGYNPADYIIKYEIGAISLTFLDDGINFTLSAVITGITTGEYNYRLVATHKTTSAKTTIIQGRVKVTDLSYKSHARKVLDAIQSTIEGTATQAQSEFMVNGRSIKYFSAEQLLVLRSTYKREVANEEAQDRISSGLGNKNKIMVRF
ncbi:MAG: hypothetical protein PHV62_07510 [Sulfuricurvum sp.]|nr:hypothetical protein [Sulfuricurvum sp.]